MPSKLDLPIDKIVYLYKISKRTANFIAKKYKCSNVTILNKLRKAGITIRQKADAQILDDRYSERKIKKYIKEYISRKPYTGIWDIAKRNHINPVRLSKVFKQRGIFIPHYIYQISVLQRVHDLARNKSKIKTKKSKYSKHITYKEFASAVHRLTYHTYKKKDKTKALDHKLSIHDAYYKKWKNPPTILELCHPVNLEEMPSCKNMIKNYRSSIKLKDLRKQITEYDKTNGPFYKTLYKKKGHCKVVASAFELSKFDL